MNEASDATPRRALAAMAITACYAAVNFATALLHEPWRDEANWWLLVRDYSLPEVLAHQSYAGSPALWCLLLFPLAKLGLPIMAQQLLAVTIATGGVWMLARHTTLGLTTCALFAAGYSMGFEYAVVSRSYALTVLLLFSLVVGDRWRETQPVLYGLLVVLLANTNAHGLVLAAMLGAAYGWDLLRERSRNFSRWMATAVMLAGGLAALVTLLPAVDFVMIGHTPGVERALVALRSALYPAPMLSSVFFVGLALLTFGLCAATRIRGHRAWLLFGGGLLGLSSLFAFHHGGSLRHHGLLLVTLLAAMALSDKRPEGNQRGARWRTLQRAGLGLLHMALLLSVDFSLYMHVHDLTDDFSGGRDMARYITENEVRAPIAAYDSALVASVLVHLPDRAVWQVEHERPGTWHREDQAYAEGAALGDDALIERVYRGFPDRLPWLLLSRPLSSAESRGWGGVYASEPAFGAQDERFFLYRPLPGR